MKSDYLPRYVYICMYIYMYTKVLCYYACHATFMSSYTQLCRITWPVIYIHPHKYAYIYVRQRIVLSYMPCYVYEFIYMYTW